MMLKYLNTYLSIFGFSKNLTEVKEPETFLFCTRTDRSGIEAIT